MSNSTHHASTSPEHQQSHGYGSWPEQIYSHTHDGHVDDPNRVHQRHEATSFLDPQGFRNPNSLADEIKARIVAQQTAREQGIVDHESIREAQIAAAMVEAGQHLGYLRIEARSTDMPVVPMQTFETSPTPNLSTTDQANILADDDKPFDVPQWMEHDYDLAA